MTTTITLDILLDYSTDYFVETGSFHGEAITVALAAGIANIRSVDICSAYFEECKAKFIDNPTVHLYLGDSLLLLPAMIYGIAAPITFWLDAHDGNGPIAGIERAPLLSELAIIGNHPVKSHVIIIDDIRLFGIGFWENVTYEKVMTALLTINPDYTVVVKDSAQYPNDIIVAYLPKAIEQETIEYD
jgi:hypothetical protein